MLHGISRVKATESEGTTVENEQMMLSCPEVLGGFAVPKPAREQHLQAR